MITKHVKTTPVRGIRNLRYQVGVKFSVDIIVSTARANKNPPMIKINPVSVSANKLHHGGTTEIVRINHKFLLILVFWIVIPYCIPPMNERIMAP